MLSLNVLKNLMKKTLKNKRSLSRIIIGLMPKKNRYQFIRNRINMNAQSVQEMEFKIATTQDELQQAFQILHDAYVEQGYMNSTPSGLRFLKYFALPSTTTIVAKKGNEVVGTMSIIRRTRMGLPMESLFNLDCLTTADTEVAEISSLAVAKKFRGQRGEVFLPLCRFLHQYCVQLMKIKYMVIAVHPTMAEVYRALFGFEDLKDFFGSHVNPKDYQTKSYDFANGNPAVPLILDLEKLYLFLKNDIKNNEEANSLFGYFFRQSFKNMHFPIRAKDLNIDPVFSLNLIRNFIELTRLDGWLENLSSSEKILLNKIYLGQIPQFNSEDMISNTFDSSKFSIKKERLEYVFKGSVEFHLNSDSLHTKVEVINISKTGFAVRLLDRNDQNNIPLNSSTTATLRFWGLNNTHIQVHAKLVWQKNGMYGFSLLQQATSWDQFTNNIKNTLVIQNSSPNSNDQSVLNNEQTVN